MVNDDLAEGANRSRGHCRHCESAITSERRAFDLGNARRFWAPTVRIYTTCPNTGAGWSGTAVEWKTDLTGEVMRRAKAVTDDLGNDAHATGDDRGVLLRRPVTVGGPCAGNGGAGLDRAGRAPRGR